jgi:Uncharacterized protein encoded in hypervariable junctions of pilus gene clusters
MDKGKTEKMLNIRTSVETHQRIYVLATLQGITLNDAVNKAIEDYIAKHRGLFSSLSEVTKTEK